MTDNATAEAPEICRYRDGRQLPKKIKIFSETV